MSRPDRSFVATIPGQHSFTGITFDSNANVLDGIENGFGIGTKGLLTIDFTIRAATLIADSGLNNPLAMQFVQPTLESTSLTMS